MIYEHLANSAGSHDMNVDGSVTPVQFFYQCPANHRAFLYRVIVQIQDTGMTHITYGGLAALANGLAVDILDSSDTSINDFTGGEPIQDNATWRSLCYDANYETKGSLDSLAVRWVFSKDVGGPVIMEAGDKFVMTVNDDLTGLTKHHAIIRGYLQHLD
jgi:hypothetical protein